MCSEYCLYVQAIATPLSEPATAHTSSVAEGTTVQDFAVLYTVVLAVSLPRAWNRRRYIICSQLLQFSSARVVGRGDCMVIVAGKNHISLWRDRHAPLTQFCICAHISTDTAELVWLYSCALDNERGSGKGVLPKEERHALPLPSKSCGRWGHPVTGYGNIILHYTTLQTSTQVEVFRQLMGTYESTKVSVLYIYYRGTHRLQVDRSLRCVGIHSMLASS